MFVASTRYMVKWLCEVYGNKKDSLIMRNKETTTSVCTCSIQPKVSLSLADVSVYSGEMPFFVSRA